MDVIDVAQRRQQEQIDHALAAHAADARAGRDTCANLDCREPIAPYRTALGAQLCLDCQERVERLARQCARAG